MDAESGGTSTPTEEVSKCTENSCVQDKSQHKLLCGQCERLVHYRCTGLPLYQLQHFLTKNYRKFVCINCTIVPDYLQNIIPKDEDTEILKTNELKTLRTTINEKTMEVDVLADTNRKLSEKIRELDAVIERRNAKTKKGMATHSKLQSEAKILKEGLQNYEEKISDLNTTLIEKDCELIEIRQNSMVKLEDSMAAKLEEIKKSLEKSLQNEVTRIETKLDQVVLDNKSYAESVKNLENVVPTVTTPERLSTPVPAQDLRTIIREEQNEQLAEETDKKSRACNYILHGVPETAIADNNHAKQRDEEYISNFIGNLGLNLEFKSLIRLGKVDNTRDQSKRPIKVVMNNELDKDRVMANLKELKGKEQYKGVSVTDDHTQKDRNTIREWIEKSKKANGDEPIDSQFEWKVRGNPKNGMRLMKFKKRIPSHQE